MTQERIEEITRFEVLTAMKISMLVFWVVMLCGPVGKYQCFGETYYRHL
jgi:hypothetical protein